ncbi:helix-turn-helix domain-containing protein [uncultured Bacteroides sp.]|uniref:helix-turn-helix domain-containing protein n=1 Tax=uncultured Bacteroides sp. TaxID=162156 RepID=UPI002AABC0A1|nr:helix-turn-helix domain-containing protein [uncultured Bacteroides sp.]
MSEIAHLNFFAVANSKTSHLIDDGFLIFDDVENLPMHNYPERLDFAVMTLCLEGSWSLELNLKQHNLSSGHFLIAMPEQILQNFEFSPDFSALFILMSKEFADNILPKLKGLLSFIFYLKDQPCIKVDEEELKCIRDYYSFLVRKSRQTDNGCRKEIIQGLMLAMFYDVYSMYSKRMPMAGGYDNRKEELFEQFIRTLSASFREQRNVIYYANELCLTPKYLSKVVKEVSGKTAGEWIDNFVILEAKVLLKSTGKSVQEIAEELHFANQSFFGKYFKHNTGFSPKEYRKSNGCFY